MITLSPLAAALLAPAAPAMAVAMVPGATLAVMASATRILGPGLRRGDPELREQVAIGCTHDLTPLQMDFR